VLVFIGREIWNNLKQKDERTTSIIPT